MSDYIRRGFELKEWLFTVQVGFRQCTLCENQVVAHIQELDDEIDKGKIIDTVIIELEKAFDVVPKDILTEKLDQTGIDKRVVGQ